MRFTRFLHAASRVARPPSLCAVCRSWGSERICEECISRFVMPVPRCRRCALEVPASTPVCGACLVDPPPFARAFAAVDYDHPWDGLVTHFKFHAALDLAPALVARMLKARDAGASRAEAFAGASQGQALLLPIPLSEARLRERGYNQAWELTKRLGQALPCETDARLLLRIKDTPHQLALPPDRRAGNVRGAFAVEPTRRAELQGRSVTLVDDVLTTGATAAEAARVLLQAGAREVSVWVLARTAKRGAL